jgi:hypothetical protein
LNSADSALFERKHVMSKTVLFALAGDDELGNTKSQNCSVHI